MKNTIKEFLQKYKSVLLLGVLISSGVAFGFSGDSLQFFRYFTLSIIGFGGFYWWMTQKKRTDERVEALEDLLYNTDSEIKEREEVINHYEQLLDTAIVKIPCVCGKNTFEGIFEPGIETIVECDQCSAKYRVTLKTDTILITEPIEDLNISKLIVDKNEDDKN